MTASINVFSYYLIILALVIITYASTLHICDQSRNLLVVCLRKSTKTGSVFAAQAWTYIDVDRSIHMYTRSRQLSHQ